MGLFGFGKRKEEGGKTVACACNGACETYEAETVNGSCCDEASNSICGLSLFGVGEWVGGGGGAGRVVWGYGYHVVVHRRPATA